MNEIVLERLEQLKDEDGDNHLDIPNSKSIREIYSINRSFRHGSSTHAQNKKIPESVINAQNRRRKIKQAKGSKQKFSMIEKQLVPLLIQYLSML